MSKKNLTNHRFSYFSGTKHVWVKADNGTQLLVIYGGSKGVTEALRDKAKFLQKLEAGELTFDKIGEYGFERMDFSSRFITFGKE